MSSTLTERLTEPTTLEQFLDWVTLPENRTEGYELHEGAIVRMPPASVAHGFLCATLSALLYLYAMQRGRGMVISNDAALLLGREPDTVCAPDVMFYHDAKPHADLPTRPSCEMPTLAVEVRSPSDRTALVQAKVNRYLRAGIPLVWVIDPQRREVIVYRNGELTEVFEEGDVLNGGAVLPGLTLPVAALFSPIGTSVPMSSQHDVPPQSQRSFEG